MPNKSLARTLPLHSRAERRIAAASKGHCTAHTVLGDGPGIRMQAESRLELSHLYLLDRRAEVSDLREQVRFRYGARSEREHVFDAVATLAGGATVAFTVKPEARLASGRFLEEMQLVAWWVREKRFADEVRLLTDADIDRDDLHNARLLAAAIRDSDPEADERARSVASSLTGALTLHELTHQTGLAQRGHQALLRLIRKGSLCTYDREPITPNTLVYWKG